MEWGEHEQPGLFWKWIYLEHQRRLQVLISFSIEIYGERSNDGALLFFDRELQVREPP